MERRVLIAIFLSFVVLYVYQALVVKPAPKPITSAPTPSSSAQRTAEAPAEPKPEAPPPTREAAPTPSAAAATPLVAESGEREIRVETKDVIAAFTNRGARLKSWRLKHYLDRDKQPQELVEQEIATHPLPFTLRTENEQWTADVNGALYKVTGAPADGSGSAPIDLKFEYENSSGLRAVKQFHLDATSYIMSFATEVTLGGKPLRATIVWGPAVGDTGETSRYVQKSEGILFQNGKVVRLQPKDIAKQPTYEGDFKYAGVDDNYFMVAALFPGSSKVEFQPVSIPPRETSKEPPRDLISFTIEPRGGSGPAKFFAGPKDFDVLASIDTDVTRAINFGMFAVLVVPLLNSLKWVNSYVGNYGWSIIILTVIINAIMFPLRHKSVVSMRKMQELQPEVKAIQDRYAKLKATDPARQKMNQELMALYRERGVNPASGCVPMLLTLPLIFAFYSLLSTSIELRGAPFFGWIHDLSIHDPFYIMPILMGASQLWQQRITPVTGVDPAQQKMMMFMPIVFTFMFLWAPAGLAIYWFVSNVWGIGQQYLTNYLIGPPAVRTVRPAAERRIKRVGGGKTEAANGTTKLTKLAKFSEIKKTFVFFVSFVVLFLIFVVLFVRFVAH